MGIAVGGVLFLIIVLLAFRKTLIKEAEGDRLKEELETAEAQINLLKIDVEALDKENRILQNIGETPER